jgi:thioredoxin-related protein
MKQFVILLVLLSFFSCVVNPVYEEKDYIDTKIVVKDDVTGIIVNSISTIDIYDYSDMIYVWNIVNPDIIKFEKGRQVHILFFVYKYENGRRIDDYNPKDLYFLGDSDIIEIELTKIP